MHLQKIDTIQLILHLTGVKFGLFAPQLFGGYKPVLLWVGKK